MQRSGQRGVRCFLAVAEGIQCPLYLGSRATFPAGKFGGMQVWDIHLSLAHFSKCLFVTFYLQHLASLVALGCLPTSFLVF